MDTINISLNRKIIDELCEILCHWYWLDAQHTNSITYNQLISITFQLFATTYVHVYIPLRYKDEYMEDMVFAPA